MLLTFPADILVAIFVVVALGVIAFLVFLGIFNAKQSQDVRNEPEDIKKKADNPDLPAKGQEDKKIDEIDEEI